MSYFGLFASLAITQLLHSFSCMLSIRQFGHNVQNFFRLNKLSRTPHFIPKTKLHQLKKVWNDERRAKDQALREQQEAINVAQQLIEENRRRKIERAIFLKKPTTLFVDTIFVPIKHVNYKVKLIHDSYGNIKESLIFEIGTNGSFTPRRCIKEALKVVLKLFYSLFLTETFFPISKLLKSETK